ncbi:hypothetical protein [Arthrobacter sp. 35W]|uniref:hypothetical protein n=1 Tax=Arthrobacter sp. 35W TaxID=1132441 RepID=UPI00041BC283|nr:hypothetical protein [Arthrobacter sp. 35W]
MSVPMIIKPSVVVATAVADSGGNFSTTVMLTEHGTYTITATGATSGVTATQVVRVVAASTDGNAAGSGTTGNGSNNNDLASTGIDPSVLVWSLIGVGALAAGAGTVVISRRRSRQNAEA